MITTDEIPDRTPVAWLNYSRNVLGSCGQVLGPNLLRELYTVVRVDFDDQTGTSHVGLAHAVTDDLLAVVQDLGVFA